MSSKIKFLLFFSFISFCATAQVKIGQNPNTIHSASIVELESTDKAFVLTRLSTAQMQAITPLNGAVVYNTDTQCVHYFNGTVWTNLCDGINTNDFSFTDNGDGTITLDDGNGNTITFNGAAQTISTLIDNGDGTYTYTNENGIETVISIAVTDNQNLQTDNTPGNISIDNGNAIAINVDDADADAQNEIQTLNYTSGVLTLSNDPNATVVNLSAFDQNAADDFSGSFNDLSDLPANLDIDATDDFNTAITFDGTNLTVSDAGGDVSTDISGLAYDDTALRADVDQNTADIDALETEQTTQNTNIATNATDIDNLEGEQTTQNNSIATNATDIDALEAEQTTQNNSIATNAADISTNTAAIAAHNTADGDLSDSNEFNTGISFDGTDLTVTDLGGDQTVDISGLAYDDTALRADVDQNTADIDALETEQTTQNNSIATNTSDISTNTAAIAAHNSADGDLSDSNEYNTGISFDGTDLTVTDLGGDQTVDISGLAYDDTALRADVDQNTADIDVLEAEQTTQNNSIATNATDIDNLEAEQTTQNNNIATNAAAISAHNTADGDLSDSNEYNTGISFDGTDLTVTDLGGDQTVDISGLAYDDTALRADVDQNTADIDNLEAEQTTQNNAIATNATDIDNLEAEQTTQNNSIATNATDIDNLEAEQTTQDNSIATNATDISTNAAAIAVHNTADGDLSDSNEYNTGISFDGTDLTVTDLGGDQTVDISGLAYDDTALRADVDQNTADIDALEAEQTTQNTNIATNATDIDNLEAEQTTQNNSIATNATDIDALEAEQTTQNTNIATNATDISTNTAAIAAHNTADGDLSDSNEYNTGISFDGTDLTVTDLGGDQTVDISGLAYDDTTLRADVDQNTADIDALETEQTTQNNSITTNASDIDALEAEQTTQNNAIATNATDIDNLEAEQTTQNNSIATNATDISTNTATIAAHNTADGDLSDSNEYNTGISFDGTDLTVTDLGGDQTVDISGLAYDDTALRADVDQNTADIDALEAEQTTQNNSIATNATDIDNLEAEQTTQNNAIATNATDIDNLEAEQTTQNNSIATNATDIDNLQAEQTTQNNSIATNATDIDNLEAEQTTQNNSIAMNATDIEALEAEQTTQNNSIATNATDISTNTAAIAAHNTADGDLSDSNEFNTGISFDGTDLTVTDLGGDQTVDISGLAYDDTALRADVDQNTADIDTLETEQTTQNNSIATNTTDIDNLEAEQSTQNNSITTNATDISTNATAIAAHNSADGDLSDSNEFNTGISFDGTDLTVTDLGGDQTVDISGLAYDDTTLRADVDQNTADIDALEAEQTTQNNSIATNATDIDNLEAEQTTQNNSIATNASDIDNLEAEQSTQNNSITSNATDISTNTAAIAAHNTADGDLSDSNEYNTGISFDGTDLTVTDLGGDQTVDISGLAYDDTALRTDVDQNTADIDALETEQTTQNTNIATNATDIDNLEAEQTTQNTNIATNATDIDNLEAEQTTQNNSIATNATDISTNAAAIAAHNSADGDLSDSNEYNTGISFDGTDLTVTDLGGDQTVDISGLAYDDTALRADVDQNTADIDALEAEQTTQNTNIATNATDIDNLEAEQTTQNNSIATNATDIDNLEAEQTTQNNSIATNATDIDNLEAEQTTQNNSISSNSAAIAAHNTADEDLSATNETNTSFSTVDVAGTIYLRISDSNGDLDVPLSDLSHTGTTGSVFFAGADGTPTENNGQLFWNSSSNSLGVGTSSPTNKLHVSGAIRSQGILNSNGTENEPAYRFNDDTNTGMFRPAADEIAFTVGGIEAMKIEETSSDTSVIINETLELEGAVLDENDSPGTAGQVLTSTATGTEWVNSMSPIKAIGKISAAGGVTKATAGVTVTRISVGYYRVTLPTGAVSDADYIIQLTQPGRGGAGNDDPGISYSNQTATSFEVIIGDNDNGGTDRSRFDSEFMFTVLDL
ncbi:hypothetical protein CSC80_12695 [Maribacter sp. 6B07]|uniref:beta strand repeat-containing protein n=1 Tax=Maribacter sp. 6B07 TaxID=2045442 RepID=UPI000C0711AE|nr:hypothetical protein [Maribacter sp. 6B07]PHN92975.1 hypothetical protein CSC80_12695 [Maribacter sp. 6B07]